MQLDNNTARVRRAILLRLARMFFENDTLGCINRIPLEMRPKHSKPDRCCIHKERAIIKYRLMALLGFGVEDETDELIRLSEYAGRVFNSDNTRHTGLTIIDEACSACVQTHYFITNACRGCYAHPCMINCPKKCISFDKNGQATIDESKCINCGRCLTVCPYHAVVYIPIPCEEECPVGAISKNDSGKETIDETKCILCGKCISSCPFGAVMEKSWVVDVIRYLLSGRETVALIAPSIVGQFNAPMEQIVGALKTLGFDRVVEVALGADVTITNEATELFERLHKGAPFMTTSCCPGYMETVKKHVPAIEPFVSHTRSPMHYTAQIVAEKYPDAIQVFIGPCVAKKKEAENDPLVDYALTFEELDCLFEARLIVPAATPPESLDLTTPSDVARCFAISGGVAAAVENAAQNYAPGHPEIQAVTVDGISKKSLKTLQGYAKANGGDFNFLEVMCCEGGCIGGAGTISNPKTATRKVTEFSHPTQEDAEV
ncbi:TPA: hypothetical protein DDW35_11855 [Candidatus Sumerlaeota bacterium]|jgi:[FeFe] hydrogenase (group B1/B3)|nr:hypothetical protein [Candidatus Sumerlaeota bacterium]